MLPTNHLIIGHIILVHMPFFFLSFFATKIGTLILHLRCCIVRAATPTHALTMPIEFVCNVYMLTSLRIDVHNEHPQRLLVIS